MAAERPWEAAVERRHAAILIADIAGFTRLMRADEEGTLRALTALRVAVEHEISQHGGRIANTAGDSLLVELPSVANGLACARAIQIANTERNADTAAGQRLLLRIGVHFGNVMVRSGDLFGDAVNVAARLQSLARPGGICISAEVRQQLGAQAPADVVDAGRRQVKNIAAPVH